MAPKQAERIQAKITQIKKELAADKTVDDFPLSHSTLI